ncbi:hypothetical protein BD310DRAFT_914626 [Dichomitus squalens]|uniref:Uncharacterized protein n=1 Tax=Dichomitus squalens TaxID=114155 RepID=A0A4Q9QBA2_9APHY|nr:hypothetical protein BD310DRAFT_914626 [Dichomitus squalens]
MFRAPFQFGGPESSTSSSLDHGRLLYADHGCAAKSDFATASAWSSPRIARSVPAPANGLIL